MKNLWEQSLLARRPEADLFLRPYPDPIAGASLFAKAEGQLR
jgi:hypothetical protein